MRPPVRHGGTVMFAPAAGEAVAGARGAGRAGAREWWDWPMMRRVWTVGYQVRGGVGGEARRRRVRVRVTVTTA